MSLIVNLERIHKDITRIICDNVDPGWSIDGQLGNDLQDIARIISDNVDPGGGQLTMVNL